MALAGAALRHVDRVVFVLPRALPHKDYDKVGLDERRKMLEICIAGEPRFEVLVTEGGLFIEIAREIRECFGQATEVAVLCGRDAAERIAAWDYGEPGAFARMLEEFEMLVAARQGEYVPPSGLAKRIHALDLEANWDHVSATEVRERLKAGREWAHLIPEPIAGLVEKLYSP